MAFTPSGEYIVKSAYHMAKDSKLTNTTHSPTSSYSIPRDLWNFVLNSKATPRVRSFLWKACKNCLSIKKT